MNSDHHVHVHRPAQMGRATRRALLVALALNAAFLVVEAVAGFVTGSLALLSDAAHMVSDVGALALAYVAALLAQRPITPSRSFGLVRAEVLGAFVNSVLLVGAAALIIKEAVTRLTGTPPPVPGLPVLVVGAAGLAVNLGSAWYLARGDRDNLNVRGALLHMAADALGSVGAIIAALLLLAGVPAADAAMSIFIALLVLWATWGLLRDSTGVLLQFAPADVAGEAIEEGLRRVPGVAGIHDLHVWSLDGKQTIVTAHLVRHEQNDADRVCAAAERLLRREFGVSHTTFQVERAGEAPCEQENCTVRPDVTG